MVISTLFQEQPSKGLGNSRTFQYGIQMWYFFSNCQRMRFLVPHFWRGEQVQLSKILDLKFRALFCRFFSLSRESYLWNWIGLVLSRFQTYRWTFRSNFERWFEPHFGHVFGRFMIWNLWIFWRWNCKSVNKSLKNFPNFSKILVLIDSVITVLIFIGRKT